jgi:hypothetical protein
MNLQSLSQSIRFSRLRSLSLLLACVFVLSSCTAKVSYRFLDWVIAWSVDDYVDWDRTQQADFDERIEKLLIWHQGTQLPEYSRLLRQTKDDFQQPLNEELLRLRLDEMTVLYADLQQRLEPDVVALMSSLSDRQVRGIEKELSKVTAKMEKKYLLGDKDRVAKDRVKGVEKFLRGLIGRLNDQQEAAIESWSDNLADSSGAWIQSRKRWAEQFVIALDARAEPEFPEQINRLFVNPQSLWDEEYMRLTEANLTNGINLVIALQPTLTDEQWTKLNKEIDQWADVFDELAAEVNQQPL